MTEPSREALEAARAIRCGEFEPVPLKPWEIVPVALALQQARNEAVLDCAAIAHRHCRLPAVGVHEDNDAARIEDEILALKSTASKPTTGDCE